MIIMRNKVCIAGGKKMPMPRQYIPYSAIEDNMFERVQTILAKQLRLAPEKITPESRIMKDLGADSLDILQLLMRIEDQYGIVIPDQALAKFDTVADVVAYLEKQEAAI